MNFYEVFILTIIKITHDKWQKVTKSCGFLFKFIVGVILPIIDVITDINFSIGSFLYGHERYGYISGKFMITFNKNIFKLI